MFTKRDRIAGFGCLCFVAFMTLLVVATLKWGKVERWTPLQRSTQMKPVWGSKPPSAEDKAKPMIRHGKIIGYLGQK